MAKVGARDLTNFYDFGPQNDPTNPELSHRMYFDLSTTIGNNVLMVADQDFNIISEYQGWPGSSIVVDTPPAIIDRLDICVLNDQGLNSFPPVANRVNPIYRMYIAERTISVSEPTLVTQWRIEYENLFGDNFTIGDNITSSGGGVGIIQTVSPTGLTTGTITVYGTSGTFNVGDTLVDGVVTAIADVVENQGQITINIRNSYDCSLLIVNQNFEIEYIVPLLEGFVPLQSLSVDSICCSYDYGFNAQSSDQNYIWHMYVGDYTIDPGTEFEQIVPNCLLIVNQDFKVVCYQTPLP